MNYILIFTFKIWKFYILIILLVGSPPKTSFQVQKMADVKRIKVSPPKHGNMYPNLGSIESTETESEFTADSTEAETATVENMTDTETGTEGDYYVDVIIHF